MKLHNAETQILTNFSEKKVIMDNWECINQFQTDVKELSKRLQEAHILGVTDKLDIVLSILDNYRKSLALQYGELCLKEDL